MVGQRNGAIESRSHARKPVANIWFSRLQRRIRGAALLSPSEKLLACAAIFSLYRSSGEAVGISTRLARLLGSRPAVLEAILDTLRVEERGRTASLCGTSATCARDDRAHSAHEQDEVRALDGQRFPTAPALG